MALSVILLNSANDLVLLNEQLESVFRYPLLGPKYDSCDVTEDRTCVVLGSKENKSVQCFSFIKGKWVSSELEVRLGADDLACLSGYTGLNPCVAAIAEDHALRLVNLSSSMEAVSERIPLGFNPMRMLVLSDQCHVLVTSDATTAIKCVNLHQQRVVNELAIGTIVSSMCESHDKRYVYVACAAEELVRVVDLFHWEVLAQPIMLGEAPEQIWVHEQSGLLFVYDKEEHALSQINPISRKEERHISLPRKMRRLHPVIHKSSGERLLISYGPPYTLCWWNWNTQMIEHAVQLPHKPIRVRLLD
ncbi:YncE family protein [Paenibacillus sp. 481]|uniref:YncE family protein n=1 Tax=Paenibacillus sp. 481 TaxID=2835869 RepID=UPI001E5CC4F6|nr:hypothetical protein [Paenibacillus sp. 481]UHA73043.1 hypothetical protein KIK04_20970 [Paenibacillus sp. 481]